MITKYYYTLNDVLDALGLNENYFEFSAENPKFANLFEYVFPVSSPSFVSDAISNELWCQYIVPYYRDTVIIIADEDLSVQDMTDKFRGWFYDFCASLQGSFPQYKVLLDQYKAQEKNLMADITSKSQSKFNDTPQSSNINNNFADDNFVSNLSTAESSTSGNTTAVRLAEIRQVWVNLFFEWRESFKPLFYVGV